MNAALKSALVRFARGLPMVVVAALMSVMVPANAAVTAFFSAGINCAGAASASYSMGTTTQVSLCVTTTTEPTCGHSIQVQAASVAESGLFRITNRTLGSRYPDPNYFGLVPYPININNPAVTADFGATVNGAPVPPTANQLLATFDITPASPAVSSTYVISTGTTFSAMSVDDPAQPGCGHAIDVLIPATFTLNYVSTPAFTSVTSVNFTVNSVGTFTVTTSGAPAPTLSIVGALPSGVTFTPATGVFSGTPALGSVGSYPITITAANGNVPNAMQSFTLVVQQASQSITFGTLANRSISSGSFTLSATGGASGNAVTFSSSTASTCTVSGNTVTLVAIGTCTIAANQAGASQYAAATTVSQSFSITSAPPPSLINQAITFGALGDRASGSGAVTVAATGGGSGNPVTFVAGPNNICSTGLSSSNSATVSLLAVGTCTVTASQAGNTGYNAAAAVSQSFNVTPGFPNAPTALACVAGVRAVRCTFTAPVANGVPPVTSYTLSCSSVGANSVPIGAALSASGGASPLTVSGLTAGTAAACSVTASNSIGAGPASNTASATPFATTALHQGIDPIGDGKGKLLVSNGPRAGSGSDANGNPNNASLLLGTYDPLTKQISFSATLDPGSNRRILGVGDFGGRNRSDLLFQDVDSGLVSFWVGFDGSVDNQRAVRTVKPGWVVDAVADLDGDGKSDIVWRYVGSPLNPATNPDDVGVVFVWFMKDGVIDQVKARGGAPLDWTLVGAADLRGVGTADLIFVSPSRQIRSLTAQANRSFVNEFVGSVPAGYTLTRMGDFDGDGKADLLFRNAQGKLKLWSMNGISIASQVDLPDSDAGWNLYAIADLNGDGTMDLIFRKPDNTLVVWLMNKATPALPTVIDNAGMLPSGAVNIDP